MRFAQLPAKEICMNRAMATALIALIATFGLAACQHDTSSPPSSGSSAANAPTVAATVVAPAAAAPTLAPAGDQGTEEDSGEGGDDIQLFADADQDSGPAPLHVRFSVDAVIDGDLDGATFTWNFGDGSPPSNERNPEHTYTTSGDYLATVRAVNKLGERGWDEIDIEVESAQLPAGEE
jgi:PKD repeat protein